MFRLKQIWYDVVGVKAFLYYDCFFNPVLSTKSLCGDECTKDTWILFHDVVLKEAYAFPCNCRLRKKLVAILDRHLHVIVRGAKNGI